MPPHPSPDAIDWELVHRLHHDQTLVGLVEISKMCGMSGRHSAWNWWRAAGNYLHRKFRQWPPTPAALRSELHGDEPDDRPPAQYFTHAAILPPPDLPGSSPVQDRWYRGTINRWGMNTRRIDFLGVPMTRVAGPPPGRGPMKGRKRTATD